MSFVMIPSRVWREAERGLKIKSLDKNEMAADYSVGRHAIEIPFGKATFLDEPKKSITSAKVGDRLVLAGKCSVEVANRVIEVRPCLSLYECGILSAPTTYKHGETVVNMVWECTKDIDLKKLPWLYEIYIHDQSIK